MTDLSWLKVSLTKHNAHKIARLLKDYKADQILDRLDEVHAEAAQAHKNLSVLPGNIVPDVWTKAKKLGGNAVDALVLVGIIFSHHELISAMANASSRTRFSGRIERGVQLDNKAYTNFARVLDQLGYATKLDYPGVTFNLRSMFEIPGLGPLVGELLELKLATARWGRSNTVAEEAAALDFHKVFGVTDKELGKWLSADAQPASAGTHLIAKDEEFFQAEDEGSQPKPFEFKSGHIERAVEPITKAASAKTKANQLHNDIQNRLYVHLRDKLGAAKVGTEIDTGYGTTIDIATYQTGQVTFYEIKTSTSVRTSIRQAIPQLLEYAFWPQTVRAGRLVIVSHLRATKAAAEYLNFLRKEFNLPIYYQQFSLETNDLRDPS